MQKGLIVAAAVFAVLLVAVLVSRGGDEKVGVKELALPSVAAADVVKIELSGKHKALLQKQGDAWQVADPAAPTQAHAADPKAVQAALDALAELQPGDFISSRKEKATELEVDDEKGLRAQLSTASGTALDVVFGKGARGGGSYARLAGTDDVYVVKGRLGQALRKDVAGWRKRQLVDVKADEITSVTVKPHDGPSYSVVAEAAAAAPDGGAPPPKATWRLKDGTALPAGFRLDDAALGRIAQSLATLRASDFADATLTDEAAGFAAPHTIVEATTAQGKPIVLHLGNEDDKKRVYARVDGDPQTYLVGTYQAKQIGKPLDELRDMTLLPSLTADDIQQIVIRHGKERVVVERKDGAFALIEPQAPDGFQYDPASAQSQAAQIARLRGIRMVSEAPAPAMGFGRASPVIQVTTKDGKTHAIKFGAALPLDDEPGGKSVAPKEHYVQGAADDHVYAITRFVKDRYEKPLELFKKVERPMPGQGPAGFAGLENLPPEVRKKLEASLKKGPPPGP